MNILPLSARSFGYSKGSITKIALKTFGTQILAMGLKQGICVKSNYKPAHENRRWDIQQTLNVNLIKENGDKMEVERFECYFNTYDNSENLLCFINFGRVFLNILKLM